MQQHLSIKRLLMIFNLFWFETRKPLILLLLAVGSFLAVWMSVYLAFRNPVLFSERFQIAYYFIGLFLSGCLSANFLFADLRDKRKSINYLLLPASTLEKFFAATFFGVVVYLIGYTLIFYMTEPIFVKLSNAMSGRHWKIINVFQMDEYKDPFFEAKPSRLYFHYFSLQALFIAGSLYFGKYSFFKTMIVLLFLWIVLVFLPFPVIAGALPLGRFNGALTAFEVIDFNGNRLIEMPAWFSLSFKIFYTYLVTIGLWTASYFLLREKQIA